MLELLKTDAVVNRIELLIFCCMLAVMLWAYMDRNDNFKQYSETVGGCDFAGKAKESNNRVRSIYLCANNTYYIR